MPGPAEKASLVGEGLDSYGLSPPTHLFIKVSYVCHPDLPTDLRVMLVGARSVNNKCILFCSAIVNEDIITKIWLGWGVLSLSFAHHLGFSIAFGKWGGEEMLLRWGNLSSTSKA